MPRNSKKQVSVSAISASVTGASKEDVALNRVLRIYHPVWFKNDEVWALINSDSKVNAMTPTYVAKLSLKVRHTDVRA